MPSVSYKQLAYSELEELKINAESMPCQSSQKGFRPKSRIKIWCRCATMWRARNTSTKLVDKLDVYNIRPVITDSFTNVNAL